MNKVSRRGFLALVNRVILAISGLMGMAGLWRFLSYAPQPVHPVEFDLGPASDYPPGSRTVVHQARAILIHTPSGFSALSTICPHLGCEVIEIESQYRCPCHGSRFNLLGEVIQGPAGESLRPLRVQEMNDGTLVLYTH